MTPWNDFLRDYAKRNKICYHCAMASRQAREEYELGYEVPVIPNIKQALRGRVTPAELERMRDFYADFLLAPKPPVRKVAPRAKSAEAKEEYDGADERIKERIKEQRDKKRAKPKAPREPRDIISKGETKQEKSARIMKEQFGF